MPPTTWDVPQQRPEICRINPKDRYRPSAVFTQGTPTNVLELNATGGLAMTEEEVTMTNVGSIMPKFKFIELEN